MFLLPIVSFLSCFHPVPSIIFSIPPFSTVLTTICCSPRSGPALNTVVRQVHCWLRVAIIIWWRHQPAVKRRGIVNSCHRYSIIYSVSSKILLMANQINHLYIWPALYEIPNPLRSFWRRENPHRCSKNSYPLYFVLSIAIFTFLRIILTLCTVSHIYDIQYKVILKYDYCMHFVLYTV